jgi:DNA-binding PadR family transcriptional regulator
MSKKLLLLGLLRRHDMYGYQLNEFIENTLVACVNIKKPTAYYVLNKMHEDGWVTVSEEQEGNRPRRRVYSLTAVGEAAFQRLLRENLAQHQQTSFAGDIGLAFLDVLPPEEALPLLQQRRAAMQAQYTAVMQVPGHPGSLQLMIEHQRQHLQAELVWLDDLITQLTQSIN